MVRRTYYFGFEKDRGNQRPPEKDRGGRPPEDDQDRLRHMARLFASCVVFSVRKAAEIAAAEDPGHSKRATFERIRKKYPKQRDELEEAAAIILGLPEELAATLGQTMDAPTAVVGGPLQKLRHIRRSIQNQRRIDPQFDRYVRRSRIRVEFASFDCLRRLIDGYSPERRLRR